MVEERNCALQDGSVRAERLNLLGAQFLYGKLEESLYRGSSSDCPWPAASKIVAPEVGRHVPATFTDFQSKSGINGCEFEEDSEVSPRKGHSYPCTPLLHILLYHTVQLCRALPPGMGYEGQIMINLVHLHIIPMITHSNLVASKKPMVASIQLVYMVIYSSGCEGERAATMI
jgi:hypothetical protein